MARVGETWVGGGQLTYTMELVSGDPELAGSATRRGWSLAAALVACAAGVALAPGAAGQSGHATVPGDVTVRASYEHLGVAWHIEGDADRDSTVTLRYREAGSEMWREAMLPVRTHPGLVGEGNGRPDNRWAGSLFWLGPGATFEIELSLIDPDGGSETRVVTATTRTPATAAPDARERFVVPGTGGGSGTPSDPFLGLQAAADAAQPGDLFTVAPGKYEPFELLVSGQKDRPIVFRGPPDGSAIVDGQGTDRGIVTLGRYDQTIGHVMVEGMTVENGRWGIDAQHSHDITVRHVVVRDVDDGYVNRRGDGLERNQTICDSVFEGRRAWPGEGIPPERAVDVKGDGNVVCNNFITNFADGVSVQPSTSPSWGNDVYGNEITHIVDDPIEIDYNAANVRVWANRVTNGRMGVSLAPIFGGPAYVFRNTFHNLESSAYKMNREPAGLIIAHNTSLKRGNGTSSPANWQNTLLRNNFLFGTRYVFEEYGLADGSVDDWDYDALAREPGCGEDSPPCFKWDNVRYATIAELAGATGIEVHAIEGARSDLIDANLPESYETPVHPDDYDLRPRDGSPEIDAGAPLANLNDPWVSDGRPDIGAFELGAAAAVYGPRTVSVPLTYVDYGQPGPTATATATPTATATATTTASPTWLPGTQTQIPPPVSPTTPAASTPTASPTPTGDGGWAVWLPRASRSG